MHKGPSLLRVFASRVQGSPNSETLPRIFSDPSTPSSYDHNYDDDTPAAETTPSIQASLIPANNVPLLRNLHPPYRAQPPHWLPQITHLQRRGWEILPRPDLRPHHRSLEMVLYSQGGHRQGWGSSFGTKGILIHS